MFRWMLHPASGTDIHILESLECSGGSSITSPLPHLSLNPTASQKVGPMMTLPPEMLQTTPTGYLNRPPRKQMCGFPVFLS